MDGRTETGAGSRIARPKAILFDWDNTLVDTWPAIHGALAETFVAFGLEPWTLAQTKARVRRSMRESFPPLFGARWQEAGADFYERFKAIHLDRLEPRTGAGAMLVDLQAAGIYLGVVSNKNGDILREEASHLGWDHFFGRIVGAFDADRDKPAPDPVDLALDGSGIARGREVWFAGDTGIDLECAVNAGCLPVLVREDGPEAGEFGEFSPVLHFGGCQALSKLVQRL